MMHTTQIKRDIEKLKMSFPDSLIMGYQLRELEERLKQAEDKDQITGHPLMQKYVETLRSQVKGIEERLATEKSDTLTDRQRDSLIDVKQVYEYFIQVFSPADQAIADVQRSVDGIKKANNIV